MSSRILWTVQLRSLEGDRSREWVCTTRVLAWTVAVTLLVSTVLAVAGATWNGHRARMAQLTLEAESEENRMLRERQAALFERVFDLVSRIDQKGVRLGMTERASMLVEAEQACLAAQYALDSERGERKVSADRGPGDLDCDRLARGIHHPPASQLRAAM